MIGTTVGGADANGAASYTAGAGANPGGGSGAAAAGASSGAASANASASGYGGSPASEAPDPGHDSLEALGLGPSRLTMTFGFGAGPLLKDGKDRYGLAKQRPEALVDLPQFIGDQLVGAKTAAISMQACADDPQVAFHAVQQLARLAYGIAELRWTQSGFIPAFGPKRTARNLMGFKDGTNNPSVADPKAMDKAIWVGEEGPDWMRGGSYLVARRIRIALEHWDRTNVAFQEQTVGRHKDARRAARQGTNSSRWIQRERQGRQSHHPRESPISASPRPKTTTARKSCAAAYSYNDGVNFTAERWPPWRQGKEYDAGLFFIAYQRDPRTGFIKIFDKMAKLDMMNQFVTHIGGGLFACPAACAKANISGQEFAGA